MWSSEFVLFSLLMKKPPNDLTSLDRFYNITLDTFRVRMRPFPGVENGVT